MSLKPTAIALLMFGLAGCAPSLMVSVIDGASKSPIENAEVIRKSFGRNAALFIKPPLQVETVWTDSAGHATFIHDEGFIEVKADGYTTERSGLWGIRIPEGARNLTVQMRKNDS